MSNLMCYKKGLIAFIDILGTKKSDFCELFNINEIFHKELKKVKDDKMYCKKFVTSFSDCAYIVYTVEGNDESSFLFLINYSLTDLSKLMCAVLANGFLCRGGVSYGNSFFKNNKKYIFGPAINEAYELEKNESMPRIIIDDSLGKIYSSKESLKIKNDYQKLIRKDEYDNRYYLNYLYTYSSNDYLDHDDGVFTEKILVANTEYNFDEYYNLIKTHSNNQIEKHSNNHNIIAKHKWQLNYLEQHIKERNNHQL